MNKLLKEYIREAKLPVVFDYDGVLFEARWYKDRINMPNETEDKLLAAMKNGECLYTKPISFMFDIVKEIKADKYVLSHIHNGLEYNAKCAQIAKYYPSIKKEHILWAKSVEDKIGYLEEIKNKYGGFIYIDDTHPALILFENHFNETCKFFHVSSLYVDILSAGPEKGT